MGRKTAFVIAALLIIAGVATFFAYHHEKAYAALSAAAAFAVSRGTRRASAFFLRVAYRVLYRFGWVLLVMPIMPELWRHRYVGFNTGVRWNLRLAGRLIRKLFNRIMRHSPRWIQFIVYGFLGIVSGLIALILYLLPVHVGKIPFVGKGLSETVMPYLLRTAAAKSIEAHMPAVWKKMPARVREYMNRKYVRLWWMTARPLVRSRQAIVKHKMRSPVRRRENTLPRDDVS